MIRMTDGEDGSDEEEESDGEDESGGNYESGGEYEWDGSDESGDYMDTTKDTPFDDLLDLVSGTGRYGDNEFDIDDHGKTTKK